MAYFGFNELLKDVSKTLPLHWIALRSTDSVVALGKVDVNADVELKVVFEGTFCATVTRQGVLQKAMLSFGVIVSLYCYETQQMNYDSNRSLLFKTHDMIFYK